MKKITTTVFISFLFIIKLSAQFIGTYSLKDGGVDAQSSQLCILPNNEFAIACISGVFLGKWEQKDTQTIVCTEIKSQAPIVVYAYKNAGNNTALSSIKFENFDGADAAVLFKKNDQEKKVYQPVFNRDPNCFKADYIVKKDLSALSQIQIMLHQNPDFQGTGLEYPYSGIVYHFPVSTEYNAYKIVFDERAMQEPMVFKLTKTTEGYFIDEKEIGEKEELTKKITDDITRYKGMLAVQEANADAGQGIKTTRLVVTKDTAAIAMAKPTEKPLFFASCDAPKIETAEQTTPLKPGYYAAKIDPSKKKGLKAVGTETYYILDPIPAVSIAEVDTVYKEYDTERMQYSLTFKFNKTATKKWAAFTQKNIGQYAGLVINHRLVTVPKIYAVITGGYCSISGGFTEAEIDKIKKAFEKEMKK